MPADSAARAPARGASGLVKATLGYAALAVALTWPLARGLARDLPGDFGDPLLNCWILAWDADHLLRALSGHLGALAEYWNANIYYPHPLALAYSDHLTMQAVQILPVYALTHNPVLCYNLLFLSTFVLSGLGMFLFARELTGNRAAAFLAGLAYAFAPYRVGSIPHLQVLSSAWMPFALFGFRRFFDTRRTRPLVGVGRVARAEPLVQLLPDFLRARPRALSRLGIDDAPAVAGRARCRTPGGRGSGGRARDGPVRPAVHDAAAPGLHGALPHGDGSFFGERVRLSHRRSERARLGRRDARVAARGERAVSRRDDFRARRDRDRRLVARRATQDVRDVRRVRLQPTVGWMLAAVVAVVLVAILFGWTLRLPFIKITNLDRVLWLSAGLSAAWLATSSRARQTSRAWISSPPGILALLTLFAVVMSFGPHIYSRGRLIEETNLYAPSIASSRDSTACASPRDSG